jgi:predicted PurR-regulated permease PerM
MALPARQQLKLWGLAGLALAVMLWALGDIIFPFVLGAALAYFLNPVVNLLERRGLPRVLATSLVSVLALFVVIAAILLVVPTIIAQAAQLANAAPGLLASAAEALTRRFPDLADSQSAMRQSLADIGAWVQARGGELAGSILGSARSFISVILLLIVVPVVGFYLLLDWNRLIGQLDQLLPRQHAPTIRRLARDIDTVVAAFVRGMGSICLIMAAYYAVALMAVGLSYGLVVGAIAGILTFIPYLGALMGGVLAIGLGLYQFWGDWVSVAMVIGVFLAGQTVESNVITPRVVGRSVGLHPVWVLLSISVFATLFGVVGMLVAVPLAAAAGVLVRHVAGIYMESPLYTGRGTQSPKAPESVDDRPQT